MKNSINVYNRLVLLDLRSGGAFLLPGAATTSRIEARQLDTPPADRDSDPVR